MSRRVTSAEALRNMATAQGRIKHRCKCGRVIYGNPGWASHLRANHGSPEHGFGGTV